MMRGNFRWLAIMLLLMVSGVGLHGQASQQSACVLCHGNEDLMGEESAQRVRQYTQGVHAEVGLSCHHCHGGNPDPGLAEDLLASMDPSYRSNPFVGVPVRRDLPQSCGKCHSDATYMKRFRPDIRVDQESEYWTSRHGQALRGGDIKVATCVDCHGVHGIFRVSSPQSPVYPTQVAETCRTCHADAQRMQDYTTGYGQSLPVDQYQRWSRSVHAQALLEKEDLSAPTCNDCHGDHGAMPPGLESITFVCGQCHGREASLFRKSPKEQAWRVHNGYLEEAGAKSCLACHDASEPQSQMTWVHSLSECTVCHGNHDVVRPTVAFFSPLPESPCAFCHEGIGPLAEEIPELEVLRQNYRNVKSAFFERAEEQGLSGDERFNWLVDQALQLEFHTRESDSPTDPAQLRPEFSELFTKFRIGKTYNTYRDPVSGQETRSEVVRCTDCHSPQPAFTDVSQGLLTGQEFLRHMQELTALTSRAERTLLAARRGGIETRDAFLLVDKAVDAQISLQALIHTFAVEGPFLQRQQEGMDSARLALEAGQLALSELSYRRQGLALSLVFIVLVLVGLGLKIRQISRREAARNSS